MGGLFIDFEVCYRANYRLGKARPNPRDGDNGRRVYPLSPQINPPLTLVKEKSNTRGESRVTLVVIPILWITKEIMSRGPQVADMECRETT
jgi:hypothetical protein